MFKKLLTSFVTSTILLSMASLPSLAENDKTKVLKHSITVTNNKFLRYWKNPKAKEPEYNYWTWSPRITFDVQGPTTAGSQIYVEYYLPNGKLWQSVNCETKELQPLEIQRIIVGDLDEKKGIVDKGTLKFVIKMKNELEGKNETLYSGTYRVEKFHVGNNLAQFKNQFEFYVDHDWTLPLSYLYFNTLDNKEAPRLNFATWFKGEEDSINLSAYLYYQDKLIASTKKGNGKFADFAGGVVGDYFSNRYFSAMTPGLEKNPQWRMWNFAFYYTLGYILDEGGSNNYEDMHNLAKNTGNYEIKILRKGKLVRSAKFTVGEDGKVVSQNALNEFTIRGEDLFLIPVKILADLDGKWNKDAWKKEMFYGNVLKDFTSAN